jgi:hypothetical protein
VFAVGVDVIDALANNVAGFGDVDDPSVAVRSRGIG